LLLNFVESIFEHIHKIGWWRNIKGIVGNPPNKTSKWTSENRWLIDSLDSQNRDFFRNIPIALYASQKNILYEVIFCKYFDKEIV
jgi:hypothetical protein